MGALRAFWRQRFCKLLLVVIAASFLVSLSVAMFVFVFRKGPNCWEQKTPLRGTSAALRHAFQVASTKQFGPMARPSGLR
jgi:hypothetical protein